MRVGIVGAGIVGLATAYELSRTPNIEVRCYEQGEPMGARSVGNTRIFRLGHADPMLVRLAVAAEDGWRRWSEVFGRVLLDPVSAVLTGVAAIRWHDAMGEAGVPAELIDHPAELDLPSQRATGPCLVDRRGGVTDVRATGLALRTALGSTIRSGDAVDEVQVIADDRARIVARSGTWDCDVVVLAAGAATPALADSVGVPAVPTELRHHHRFTFSLRQPAARPPCWLDQSEAWRPGFTSYQHLVAPGLWAVGGSLPGSDTAWELGPEETGRRARVAVTAYVADRVEGLHPDVVDVVHCNSMTLGDGLGSAENGPVIVIWGDNLMKFAPALGGLLARSAAARRLAPELIELSARTSGQVSRTAPM